LLRLEVERLEMRSTLHASHGGRTRLATSKVGRHQRSPEPRARLRAALRISIELHELTAHRWQSARRANQQVPRHATEEHIGHVPIDHDGGFTGALLGKRVIDEHLFARDWIFHPPNELRQPLSELRRMYDRDPVLGPKQPS